MKYLWDFHFAIDQMRLMILNHLLNSMMSSSVAVLVGTTEALVEQSNAAGITVAATN